MHFCIISCQREPLHLSINDLTQTTGNKLIYGSKMENLFDKYGGIEVMRELIKEFYAQVYARPEFKTYFAGTDLGDLIQHQRKFFAYAMGKPAEEYKDEWLERGHKNRKISETHYLRVAELLRRVLLDAGVENEHVKDIMIAVASKRAYIVNL